MWKKDYDRVIALAKGAYNSTTVSEMQAESLFQLGRVHHVRHEYENALKLYEKACKLAPDLTPARFGLAQTLLAQDDYKGSMTELKKVVLKSATATDALALLGLLQVRAGQTNEGLLNLHKAMDLDPLNPDLILLEALALQQDKSTYSKSLERYQKAVELLESSTQAIPYELFCNLGVLCHETKDYGRALNYYKRALDVLDSGSILKTTPALVCHPANDMFWSFVDTEAHVVSPSGEGSVILEVQGVSVLQKGDFVRIGDEFCTEVVNVHVSSIEVKDAGQALVDQRCAKCHSTGKTGTSPYPGAQPFRNLGQRWRRDQLREALLVGIIVEHDKADVRVPPMKLTPAEADSFLDYLQTIATRENPAPR